MHIKMELPKIVMHEPRTLEINPSLDFNNQINHTFKLNMCFTKIIVVWNITFSLLFLDQQSPKNKCNLRAATRVIFIENTST